MKIKTDFISNSSSAIYIVAIPSSFEIENYLTLREHANIFLEYEKHNMSKEVLIEKVKSLKRGSIMEYDIEDNSKPYLYVILNILTELGLHIDEVPVPDLGYERLINILHGNCEQKIRNILEGKVP